MEWVETTGKTVHDAKEKRSTPLAWTLMTLNSRLSTTLGPASSAG